jgi:hypothetical protein
MVWNDRAFRAIVDLHKNESSPKPLSILCCDETTTHSPHDWLHYNIDLNVEERLWCTGDFLTTPQG